MSDHLVMMSDKPEDIAFGEHLALSNRLQFMQVGGSSALRNVLKEDPNPLLFWNGDNSATTSMVSALLQQFESTPLRKFIITDEPLNQYPYLRQLNTFSHHLFRRFARPLPGIYARLVGAVATPHPFGIARYFPNGSPVQKLKIRRSSHKLAAAEAIQNVFTKANITPRLAALVAQAADELVMNAIFDAPTLPNGMFYRKNAQRAADFELIEQEEVDLEVISTADYVGLSVADKFGSLKKDVVLKFLTPDYSEDELRAKQGGAMPGLGIHGLIQSGLSLIFVCQPGVRTEVSLIFPKAENFRAFREGFRFLSLIVE